MVITNLKLVNELRKYSRDELREIAKKLGCKFYGRTKEERIHQIINKSYENLYSKPPFDDIDKLGVEIVRQAYYSIKKRREKLSGLDGELIYKKNLSVDLYCHYEDEK
jgi:hypothetical protein